MRGTVLILDLDMSKLAHFVKSEAVATVIVDDANGLQVRIDDGSTYELEAVLLQIFGNAVRQFIVCYRLMGV